MFDLDFQLINEKMPKILKDDENEKKSLKNFLRSKYKSLRYF